MSTANRGFASMTPEAVRRIARLGGSSHSKEHMAAIGRKGGVQSGIKRKLIADEKKRNSDQV